MSVHRPAHFEYTLTGVAAACDAPSSIEFHIGQRERSFIGRSSLFLGRRAGAAIRSGTTWDAAKSTIVVG
jgi:hypothetical protein